MKLVFMVEGASLLFLAFCKGETTACDCTQGLNDMMADYTEAGTNQTKLVALTKKTRRTKRRL